MSLHARSQEDMQEEFDRGYNLGLKEAPVADESEAYQNGQVLMRDKILVVLQKYYGPSVYSRIEELVSLIPLEE